MASLIKTYNNESFRNNYVQPESDADALLQKNFEQFFIAKFEDLIAVMKPPVPPTRSTNFILLYLTKGNATFSVGPKTYKIIQNECLLIPAGQIFSVDYTELMYTRGYLCNFHSDFINGWFGNNKLLKDYILLRVWAHPQIHISNPTADSITHLFSRMLSHYSSFGLTQPVLLQANFLTVLSEIFHAYQPLLGIPQIYAVQITSKFKELLFTYVKTHHLVTEYADLLNITPNHLNKSVKLITGKPPIKWIGEAIVMDAKILLYQTNLSISEIAAQVGMSDTSYFSRLFKKHMAITPLTFRKRIEIA